MSASNKKKLRQEQLASSLTERQTQEKKDARKLKLYSILFCVVIVAMIAVVIFTTVTNSGIIERNTTALKVNDHKVSAAELNYFFLEAVNNFNNNYGSYVSMLGLDTTVPLDQQEYSEDMTWADYFVEQAKESARSTYALYDAAMAEGYTLSDEEKESINDSVNAIGMYAGYNGFTSANSYIKAIYGKGANEKNYRAHQEMALIANSYYQNHQENLVYTDADLRAAETDHYNEYSSFNYSYYLLNASAFYEGGTEDADGNVTYSDEEMQAGLAAAEEAANTVCTAATSLDAMNEAIAALEINSGNENAAAITQTDVLYDSVLSNVRDWVADSTRQPGDATVVPVSSTDSEGTTTISGYYVAYFDSVNDNIFPLVNVRHVLVANEGGEQDENGQTVYSDEDYAKTQATAEEILQGWDGTEEGFAKLAEEKSADTASVSTGGLYENVYPGQMVPNFNDWCFDSSRKVGDTGIVQSDYGYHIMYFSGYSDTTYRDYMIENKLRSADMESWYNALVEAVTVEAVNVNYVNGGMILNPNNTADSNS